MARPACVRTTMRTTTRRSSSTRTGIGWRPCATCRSEPLVSREASVRVRAPARLHLGFLDMEGGLGRSFGSLGVTIEDVWTELLVTPTDVFAVTGAAETARARAVLERLASAWNLPSLGVVIERA